MERSCQDWNYSCPAVKVLVQQLVSAGLLFALHTALLSGMQKDEDVCLEVGRPHMGETKTLRVPLETELFQRSEDPFPQVSTEAS